MNLDIERDKPILDPDEFEDLRSGENNLTIRVLLTSAKVYAVLLATKNSDTRDVLVELSHTISLLRQIAKLEPTWNFRQAIEATDLILNYMLHNEAVVSAGLKRRVYDSIWDAISTLRYFSQPETGDCTLEMSIVQKRLNKIQREIKNLSKLASNA